MQAKLLSITLKALCCWPPPTSFSSSLPSPLPAVRIPLRQAAGTLWMLPSQPQLPLLLPWVCPSLCHHWLLPNGPSSLNFDISSSRKLFQIPSTCPHTNAPPPPVWTRSFLLFASLTPLLPLGPTLSLSLYSSVPLSKLYTS